jgi:hypothetical protein
LEIVGRANKESIPLRIMGASAFRIHCAKYSYLHRNLGRSISDLDFASYHQYTNRVVKLLQGLGYKYEKFYYEDGRQIFKNEQSDYIVDVFFDQLSMCHRIDFRNRLENDFPTIPLAELLLEKMQIVEFTEKDAKDSIMLLREHCVGEDDSEAINGGYVAELLSKDWGFYHTVTTNLKKMRDSYVDVFGTGHLSSEDKEDVRNKIDELLARIEEEPKNVGWKMRARVGTRKLWYQEVESRR